MHLDSHFKENQSPQTASKSIAALLTSYLKRNSWKAKEWTQMSSFAHLRKTITSQDTSVFFKEDKARALLHLLWPRVIDNFLLRLLHPSLRLSFFGNVSSSMSRTTSLSLLQAPSANQFQVLVIVTHFLWAGLPSHSTPFLSLSWEGKERAEDKSGKSNFVAWC